MNFIQKAGQAWRSLEETDFDFGKSAPVRQIADAAYKANVAWFGAPQDSHWAYAVVQGAFTGCTWSVLTRSYTLVIGREHTRTDQLCSAIGHEMYYRVTGRRKTLRRQMWIDELLAFSAQQQFLRAQGFAASAEEVDSLVRDQAIPVNFDRLREARTTRILFGAGGVRYPADFGVMIGLLFQALDRLLEWPEICLLANAPDLQAWYAQLEPSDAALAMALLTSNNGAGAEEGARLAPLVSRLPFAEDPDGWRVLAQAYHRIGHCNAAETLLHRLLAAHPEQPIALMALGNMLYQQKRYVEALNCFEQALVFSPGDASIRRDFGLSLYVMGRKEEAREQLQIVVDQGDAEHSPACAEFLAEFWQT